MVADARVARVSLRSVDGRKFLIDDVSLGDADVPAINGYLATGSTRARGVGVDAQAARSRRLAATAPSETMSPVVGFITTTYSVHAGSEHGEPLRKQTCPGRGGEAIFAIATGAPDTDPDDRRPPPAISPPVSASAASAVTTETVTDARRPEERARMAPATASRMRPAREISPRSLSSS